MKRVLLPACALATLLAGRAAAAGAAAAAMPPPPAGNEAPAAMTMPPVIKEEGSSAGIERAIDNYRKLLELPQTPEARAETQRRIADLELQQVEQGNGDFKQGEKLLRDSAALYEQLLQEHPQSPGNDRVLYQMSRAYQDLGEYVKAEAALARMIGEFPQSRYGDDAHFRRAELLYKAGVYEQAGSEYQHSLNLEKSGAYFEPAQYKFGWCEYKLGHYESALNNFIAILTRELPAGEQVDPEAALAGVRQGKKDTAADALRVIVLTAVANGGGEYLNKYLAARTEPAPAFTPMLYVALADHLYQAKRYSESANAAQAFIASHPNHALAPAFQTRAIAALDRGGFADLVVKAKERYVADYDPTAPRWQGQAPGADVMDGLRHHLEDLATYYHARGQKARAKAPADAHADFAKAGTFYKRILELFPQDPKVPDLTFLLAESYSDSGDTLAAAQQYTAAAGIAGFAKAPEAAYAAALAYHKHSGEVPDADKPAALRLAVQSGIALADHYPQHPQALPLLTRAAEDLYQLQAWDEAITTAGRILNAQPPAPDELRRTAWDVTADAQFAQKHYAEAEAAYRELLKLTAPKAKGRGEIEQQIAQCVYKQGEAARAAGDLKSAATLFARVDPAAAGTKAGAASLYDAGASAISLKDWAAAETSLEKFRSTFPQHELIPEVDKKLAVVYQNDGKPQQAAAALERIAARTTETADTRRDAAWLALSLLDQAKDPGLAKKYEAYVKQYPQPLDPAMQSRKRLAEMDATRHAYWQEQIIAADAAAGPSRTPLSRSLAAEAQLERARQDAQAVTKIALKQPLKASLTAKKEAMERAVGALTRAVDYGVAEVATAATYELGELYRQFGQSLLASERPRKMSALMEEQYKLQLQDQAFPFEEKAIQYHESNLQHVAQGVNDTWVSKSLQALSELAPGQYGKREQNSDLYEIPNGIASEHYAHALGLIKTHKWQEAQDELTAFLKGAPGDSAAHTNLGIVYVHTGHKDLAVVEFTQAGAMDPHNAVAYDWLGALARESGDLRGAEDAYHRALQADPKDANAHLNLGVLYDQYLRRPADALSEYRAYQDAAGKTDLRAAVWIADLQKGSGT